jgi:site-specific recombinase XerC
MASLHTRKNSPFWWLKFKDQNGVVRFRSTGKRRESALETSEAQELRADAEKGEINLGRKKSSVGWEWVTKALSPGLSNPATKRRTLDRWMRIEVYLLQSGIRGPAYVTADTVADYIEWRTTHKKRSGKTASRNTAIYEVRLLSRVMRHAVRRRLVQYNPMEGIPLSKEPAKEKPAMTEEEIAKIRAALPNKPKWMGIAFEIALATGCRLRETQIPLKCIDFDKGTITFPSPKGGTKRAFTIPMPTSLRPLLESLKDKEVTCKIPYMASKEFGRDFLHRELKMPHLCFHCLRVTKVTQMLRADVPLSAAMRLVNHSDELVHRIYQRYSVDDLMKYRDVGVFGAKEQSLKEK